VDNSRFVEADPKKERLWRNQKALNWGLCPQTPTRGLHPWTRRPEKQKPPRPKIPSPHAHRKSKEQERLIGGSVATAKATTDPKPAARTGAARAKSKSG